MTKWLELNKVWFFTLLPLCVSIAIAVAAIAACRVDMKQAQLAAIEIEKQNLEKQPFFQLNKNMTLIKSNIFILFIILAEKLGIVTCM